MNNSTQLMQALAAVAGLLAAGWLAQLFVLMHWETWLIAYLEWRNRRSLQRFKKRREKERKRAGLKERRSPGRTDDMPLLIVHPDDARQDQLHDTLLSLSDESYRLYQEGVRQQDTQEKRRKNDVNH